MRLHLHKIGHLPFLMYSFFFFVGCGDGESIAIKKGSQFLGRIHLVHEKSIDLPLNPAPAFGAVQGLVVGQNHFLIVDSLTEQVYIWDSAGQFAGTIGRRGKGPGEYMNSSPMAIGITDGNIYIYDTALGRLNKYDAQGTFIADLNEGLRFGYMDRLLTDAEGDLLQLFSKDGIATLSRIDSKNLERVYSTPLTTQVTDSIVIHMSNFAGYCYSPSRNRLYYLVPTDYRIKELDVATGEILGEFGIQPPGFRPLPEQYQGLGEMKDPKEMEPIKKSTTFLVGGMFLVEDRYLIVGHKNPGEDLWWCIYDLSSPGGWYTFDDESASMLKNRRIAEARDKFLYFYNQPTDKELDTSNGRIELYTLSPETL